MILIEKNEMKNDNIENNLILGQHYLKKFKKLKKKY